MPKLSKRLSELKSSTAELLGGSPDKPMMIESPLVIMFEHDGRIICHLHPRETDNYKGYGILMCDLVRHIAKAFKVDEDDVWEWVDKERNNPTSEMSEFS
jgi:hypothetical protein